MMSRYQLAGALAYRQGLPLWLNPFEGPKGYAWAVGWGLEWAGDEERMVGDGKRSGRGTASVSGNLPLARTTDPE